MEFKFGIEIRLGNMLTISWIIDFKIGIGIYIIDNIIKLFLILKYENLKRGSPLFIFMILIGGVKICLRTNVVLFVVHL